ncbi:DUF2589 domain-containing protein [Motiliproteus sediminis]|uniref:DUF2589 domain-containing protein n=1 Tax=Motiliproteus sediminis TaxID=1468178 RepID=UPI001AF027E3|nr:DUF2589 domain-containing protein [Motiliproteus sediminis]
MAQADIRELRNLPLSDLITSPLNAVISAQSNAALSTAQFIEQIGFTSDSDKSLFDDKDPSDKHDIRMAELKVKKKLLEDDGNGGQTVKEVDEYVAIPFITLFNIPAIEISEMNWDFNVKLKSVQSLETSFTKTFSAGYRRKTEAKAGLAFKAIEVGVNSSMTVEASIKTDFEMRHKASREQEYNLHIGIKANSAPLPKGIERLLGIAERIATESEEANAHEAANS